MSLISESNKEQKKAITHGGGPQLIIAGAGTGKTRVITTRMAWLITEKRIKTDEVLALTFTDKAAEEMEERVDQMMPYGYVDLWILTFHSFCDKVLKKHGLEIGLPDDYKLLDQTEAWLLIRKNLARFNLDYYKPMGNPTKFIHALINHFSRCKDQGIQPKDYLDYAEELKMNNDAGEFVKSLDLNDLDSSEREEILKQEILRIEEVAEAYHTYQNILLENNSFDFADLINYTIRLFKERPLILQKYKKKFKYILVDEFQDTNVAQYELIKMLSGPDHNLTVVGDDDQSIYKFRGASISNIMQFKEDYPQAEEVVLTENYRSVQKILDLSHKFIVQNDPYRLEEKLGIDKRLKSHIKQAGIIEHLHQKTVEQEAKTVVEKIMELRKEENKSWSDFAILFRANSSADLFIHYLQQAEIPYQFLAMKGLYNKPVVVDILNYFKLLDNYHEGTAVFRLLNSEFMNIPNEQVSLLIHKAKKQAVSLFSILKKARTVKGLEEKTLKKIDRFLSQIDKDSFLAKDKEPSKVMLNFIYNSGYLEYLNNLSEPHSRKSINYLQQFYSKIQEVETGLEDARLVDFMEIMEMELESGEAGKLQFDLQTGPDMVKLMTVHSAKGLEFDYVFMTNLVDRKFPTDQRKEPIEIPNKLIKEKLPEESDFHIQEERRLFYVAMTRAKKGLFFTSAEDYGGNRKKKISRFLKELGLDQPTLQSGSADSLKKVSATEKTMEKVSLPKKFSFSQMQTYETCPYKYYLANILKVPTFGSHYLSFGSTIHNCLQKFLEKSFKDNIEVQSDLFSLNKQTKTNTKSSGLGSLDELLSLYKDCWIDEWYENEQQKKQYFKKGEQMLKDFLTDFKKEKPDVFLLEQPFNIKVGGYSFTGRIDRVDNLSNGKKEIIDYKTGKAKDKVRSSEKSQLLFYQIAAEEALNYDLQTLTYYYLEAGKRVSFIGTEKDKDKLKEKFLNNVTAIKNNKFEAKPSAFICKNCEYKDICEYRKLK
ncbi:MAG TPA: ATP-dependent DNA helicase [Patescibacteria group bacterium]|nr:ATP-dependent DNA helicase [Patescibacteria group bacterium]